MLPGATATQLGIFLGYRRAGWWGGLLAGLGFCAPAFAIMLALTLAYSAFGVSPTLRAALYGLGPIVLAVFGVALYRLGRTPLQSVRTWLSLPAPGPRPCSRPYRPHASCSSPPASPCSSSIAGASGRSCCLP